LQENLAAGNLEFTDAEIATIEETIPRGSAAGERYPAFAMSSLNG
jgi:hypothetical protein